MSREIVINVSGEGVADALHFDEFPLHFLGRAKIERASEIFFHEKSQTWSVILPGDDAAVPEASGFAGYDEARRFEVEWLQACMKAGRISPTSEQGRDIAEGIRGR